MRVQADLFANAHSHLPYIDAVTILPELSSEKVLTMVWVDGESPNGLMLRCEAAPEGSEEWARLRARPSGGTVRNCMAVECVEQQRRAPQLRWRVSQRR